MALASCLPGSHSGDGCATFLLFGALRFCLRSTGWSDNHPAAFVCAVSAHLDAALAVVVLVLAALVGTPVADLRTDPANLSRHDALPRHEADAEIADGGTLDATFRAIVPAVHARHFGEAHFARDRAFRT